MSLSYQYSFWDSGVLWSSPLQYRVSSHSLKFIQETQLDPGKQKANAIQTTQDGKFKYLWLDGDKHFLWNGVITVWNDKEPHSLWKWGL